MSKPAHVLLFAVVSLFLFGLFALPGLANEKPLTSNYVPPSDMQLTASGQITFTPVATIYLPIVYKPIISDPPPNGSPVEILPNYSHYVTDSGYLHVVGEVRNNTTDIVDSVRITASFFNDAGQLLDDDVDFIYDLPPGEKTCFELFLNEPVGWSYYEFETPEYDTDGTLRPNLTVVNDSGTYNVDGRYRIIGQIRNDHGTYIDFAKPIFTLYNNSGVVVDCGITFVETDDLNPGQTGYFERTFYDRDYSDVASYRIQTDGNPEPSTPPADTPDILLNHSYYVDSGNYLHIVGEIQNNSPDYFYFPKVILGIFDDAGQLVEIDYTFPDPENLPPGEKTCFNISLENPPNWSYYEFDRVKASDTDDALPNLTVLGDVGAYDPTFGWYKITGQVRNDHGVEVKYVEPIATLYDTNGNVFDCDFTFVDGTDLSPGQIGDFEITASSRDNYDQVTSYRLIVDGNPQ